MRWKWKRGRENHTLTFFHIKWAVVIVLAKLQWQDNKRIVARWYISFPASLKYNAPKSKPVWVTPANSGNIDWAAQCTAQLDGSPKPDRFSQEGRNWLYLGLFFGYTCTQHRWIIHALVRTNMLTTSQHRPHRWHLSREGNCCQIWGTLRKLFIIRRPGHKFCTVPALSQYLKVLFILCYRTVWCSGRRGWWGGGLYEGDGCWRWHLSPHGTCQCLCWHVRSDGEQDLWQAAFKNLPLGNTASLTSLLKAHTWPASRRREGEFSISLPPPPPFPSTSIYPPLSLEYYAKSALFSHLPLTYQMHARQPLFNTEQEKWRAGWQSVAIRMDTWWLMLLLLSLSPPKTLHIFQSNKLKHWSSIAEFGTSSFSPKTIQFTVKHQSG